MKQSILSIVDKEILDKRFKSKRALTIALNKFKDSVLSLGFAQCSHKQCGRDCQHKYIHMMGDNSSWTCESPCKSKSGKMFGHFCKLVQEVGGKSAVKK
jgi:hypothetical protein